ncbi:DHA2 family efflux MFS transporter permease subunit [Telmatospirillum siberiense]|uniref:EmrB/QacA family drug resistance transporter n=1 Tax=Telmatospirillum siberiense TaxID=382514 RepID=A0A2N3PMW6_9PROT|nr:DHA2 family efflux MFS transporter permease subunit [Telmatospirillum siberiense]PKU21740.1 EmrB/QacA family drug resistance transporter [Telmatospirillum siberiense]
MSGPAATDRTRTDWRPAANPWIIALAVTLPTFMEVLDTTIVNVALPHIAGSLSASSDDATWTLTSYLVANGIVLPISGWLGRVFGRRRYFLVCIGMFTLCSLLCGLASSLPELVLFRIMQGFFGGGLQPNQQSILLDTFEPAKRGTAFSITAIATIVAPILGPTMGGWITDNFSWQWVFLINVPVGILSFLAVVRLVEDPPWAKAETGKTHIDQIGLALIALGLGCLQVVLDRGEDEDWLSSPFIQVFAVAAVIGLVGAVVWLLTTSRPVVNLRALADRNFALGSLMIFGMAVVLYSSAVLIPQLAQTQLGYNATWAGLILSPGTVLTILFIPVVLRLMRKVQTRFIIAFGFLALGASLLYAATLNPQVDFTTLALMRAAQTAALAFLFVPISTIAYSSLSPHLNGDAASLYTMFRNIGGSIGISLATAYVTEHSQVHMAYLSQHLSPYDPAYAATLRRQTDALSAMGTAPVDLLSRATGHVYQMLQSQAAILAYVDAFQVAAGLALLLVPLTLLFAPIKAGGRSPQGH